MKNELAISNSQKSTWVLITTQNCVNWTCVEMIAALDFLLDNTFIRFGDSIYRQVIGIPMGTNCAPLIADLFLYCYESEFMTRINKDATKNDFIQKFNNTYRYLDDILATNNDDFDLYSKDIYPKELTFNKANTDNKHCPFFGPRHPSM